MTTELEDPGTYGRIVRGADGERRADRRGQGARRRHAWRSSRSRRSTPAPTPSPAPPSPTRSASLSNDNAQGEYYLRRRAAADPRGRAGDRRLPARRRPGVNLGVNDRVDLARVTEEARRRILEAHMRAGVTIVDPAATWIDAEVEIAPDVTIAPGSYAARRHQRRRRLGDRADDDPDRRPDRRAGDGAPLLPDRVRGRRRRPDRPLRLPAARRQARRGLQGRRLRRDQELARSATGAKVPHLSYVGDAEIGAGANLGAGTITANYDGFRKHRTKVGKDAQAGRRHRPGRTRRSRRRRLHWCRFGDHRGRSGRRVWASSRAEQENVEGYAEKKAKEPKEGEGLVSTIEDRTSSRSARSPRTTPSA